MIISKLQTAFTQIETLSISEQEYIADAILDDIKWWLSLLQSQDELAILAEEALIEFEQGETINEW